MLQITTTTHTHIHKVRGRTYFTHLPADWIYKKVFGELEVGLVDIFKLSHKEKII